MTNVMKTFAIRSRRAGPRSSAIAMRIAAWTAVLSMATGVSASSAPEPGAERVEASSEVGDAVAQHVVHTALPAFDEFLGGMPTPPADRILRAQSKSLLGDPAALLRAAGLAIEQEDFSHADWLYAQLSARHAIIGDHAGLRRARLQLDMGRAEEARQIAERTLADFAESPLRAELHELVGEALVASRNESAAREAWSAALSDTQEDVQRAALLRRVARSEERSGEDRAAAVTWRLLWYAHPASEEAKQASHRLDVIEAHLGEQLRRASDWRRRGDRLFRKRLNEEALAAYDRALEMGLSASETRRTGKQRAQTLFRMRRYPEAVSGFESLPQTGDTPIWLARSMARADRVLESIAAFEKVARKSGPNRLRAHYLAALLLDGRDRDEEARAHFKVLAEDKGENGMHRAALWRLGWSDFRHGRFERAALRFEALADATADPIDRLRPVYWQGRALEAAGRSGKAQLLFAELAEEYPLAYYGWRARERTGRVGLVRPEHVIDPGRAALPAGALERIRILMEAGLVDAGADETARLVRRARGLNDRIALARLLTSARDFNRAQRVIVDAYTAPLARGPIQGLEELWRYAWPSAYSGLVDAATASDESVDPELVYSIMREESGYRPKIISPVGARGLLQIMRETGAQLADRSGRATFDPDDLFDPRTNIELGSFYLFELSKIFPTKLSASIASYNAGPRVVSDWVDENTRPDDEWVESIPYSQTRGYVKRVMRSVQAYRLLY
ncbi:MAG: tetratricopeptide repeat protein [bacterium]|nr:tetratricopeptide repeat protein [bacterium]